MKSFEDVNSAYEYISGIVDRPVRDSREAIGQGITLESSSIDLGNGKFTNSYDLIFNDNAVRADIIAFDRLISTSEYMGLDSSLMHKAVSSGGFFYLADRGSGAPRQLALNLSVSHGYLRSLPVSDRETVMSDGSKLEVRALASLGSLGLNGYDLSWSGSLTDYDTDAKVFSNGNAKISHVPDELTGSARVLDEVSRYTPDHQRDDLIDVGFIRKDDSFFLGIEDSDRGGVDIFSHDFVLRFPSRFRHEIYELEVNTIGGFALRKFQGGAFSSGPRLNIADLSQHPINYDLSLGTNQPFTEIPLARSVLYKSEDGLTHLRLFDGRPASQVFADVTPTQVISQILSEGSIEWGCFLDPGQTS